MGCLASILMALADRAGTVGLIPDLAPYGLWDPRSFPILARPRLLKPGIEGEQLLTTIEIRPVLLFGDFQLARDSAFWRMACEPPKQVRRHVGQRRRFILADDIVLL